MIIRLETKNPAHYRGIQTILRLAPNNDYQEYAQFLQYLLDELRRVSDTEVGDQIKWGQGWRQCLQFLVDLPETAKTLAKAKRDQEYTNQPGRL